MRSVSGLDVGDVEDVLTDYTEHLPAPNIHGDLLPRNGVDPTVHSREIQLLLVGAVVVAVLTVPVRR